MTAIDTAGRLPATVSAKEVRRVVLSSYLGSVLEYYDFLLYGMAAALVFGPVFFSDLSPSVATIASLGTFAAGYVARPLGGVVFGHFGDRIGRKSMLVLSMTVMGVASFLIGLIPPASAIGSWGAVILVTLRVMQGIAVGGEWGGATLMALEHAEPKKRGLMAAFTNAGAPSGGVLGTLILMAFSTLPEDQFLAWGWRVPFLLSAVMLGIGLFVRSRVSESPLFQAAVEEAGEKRDTAPPLLAVLKKPKVVLLTAFACLTSFALQSAITAFGVTYAVDQGTPRSQVLLGFAVGNFCAIFGVLAYARLSDRVGRRPVMLFGYLAAIALIYPMFQLLAWGGFVGAMLAFLLFNLFQNAVFGPMAAFISEQFGTGSRYTGASLGFQLATLLGGGFTPMILASLSGSSGSITSACVFLAALAAISICCLLAVGETKNNDLAAG
ncbi:MFS transporter [Streptomyces sp. UC4497]